VCLWGEWQENIEGRWVCLCDHPLGKLFCDYVLVHTSEQDECPLYQPIEEEPSWIEEEVRQYLEYTEGRESGD